MIIGKPITILTQGGLTPIIRVHAPSGSTVTCDGTQGTEQSGVWDFPTTLGTHTIVATKNGASKTVSVLVDEVALYEVEIVYRVYLYNEGDECTSLTGGWLTCVSNGTGSITKNATSINLYSSNTNAIRGIGTTNQINVSNYSKLCVYYTITSNGSQWAGYGCVSKQTITRAEWNAGTYNLKTSAFSTTLPYTGVGTIDLSSITFTSAYLHLYASCGYAVTANVTIYQVWLE